MALWGLYLDPVYLLLFIVTLVISGASQLYIRSTFSRWSQVANGAGLPGVEVGQRLVSGAAFARAGGVGSGVTFKIVPGDLSDHFDPRTREVGLSQEVASRPSVAAMAVTAHEVGHAQQHAEGTFAMKARSFLVPAVTFSPIISYLFIFLGLILNITGLFWIGIVAFGLMVVFTILTLPVEIGASRRALVMLRESGMLAGSRDEEGVRKVLTAAALTYVAAAVTAVLTLLYYLSLARR
jgi:Zn-dependent membrane protease YugP